MTNAMRLRTAIVGACLVVALLAGGFVAIGQEKGTQDAARAGKAEDDLPKDGPQGKLPPGQPAREDEFGFQETWQGVRLGLALQMIATTNPVAVVFVRLAAAENPLTWPDWELTLDRPLPLAQHLLMEIKDKTSVPRLTGRPLSDLKPDERAYYRIACQAMIYANLVARTDPSLFEKAAQEHDYVTYAHLINQPGRYRGEVVPVVGRMIRLRRWEAPRLAQENGVEFFWEGWVAGKTKGSNPYCIVFTSLPEGLKEAENMDRPVRFYGYFIKVFRYEAKNDMRFTPVLIGPTVILEKATTPPPDTGIFSRDALFAVAGGSLALTVVVVGLMLYFRRGDRKVQARLAALRDQPLVLGSEETDPPPREPREPDPDFGPHGRRDGT